MLLKQPGNLWAGREALGGRAVAHRTLVALPPFLLPPSPTPCQRCWSCQPTSLLVTRVWNSWGLWIRQWKILQFGLQYLIQTISALLDLVWFGAGLQLWITEMFFGPCPSVTLHSSSTKNNKIQGFLLTPATLFWGDSSSERAVMSHSPPPQTNPTQLERISLSGISKY